MDTPKAARLSLRKNYQSQIVINVRMDLKEGENCIYCEV